LSRKDAPPLAYIAGGLGTLIGADLTNLDKVRGLGAPVASIGGAATFYPRGAACEPLHATPCTLNTAAELSLTIHLLRLEPPREAASFALSALPSPYHQCARTWRGETVRTVRIVRARDSPLCSNGFASCPAVDGGRTQWMVLPGTVRGNHLKSNGRDFADGADANFGRRSGSGK
jgi:Protein of unknown function (DUF1614)